MRVERRGVRTGARVERAGSGARGSGQEAVGGRGGRRGRVRAVDGLELRAHLEHELREALLSGGRWRRARADHLEAAARRRAARHRRRRRGSRRCARAEPRGHVRRHRLHHREEVLGWQRLGQTCEQLRRVDEVHLLEQLAVVEE